METDFAWLLLLYKCAEQIPRNANAATHNREPLRAQPCMAKGRPRIEIAQSKRRDGTHKWKEGDGGARNEFRYFEYSTYDTHLIQVFVNSVNSVSRFLRLRLTLLFIVARFVCWLGAPFCLILL